MRRYNERGGDMSFAQRFRFNNLSQTYAKYVDMWRKKTMQKEGGLSQHHFGAAAKAIEAARAREIGPKAASEQPPPVSAAEAADRSAMRGTQTLEEVAAFALSFSDPDREQPKIITLYQKLVEAHQASGEMAAAPNLQAFERFVRKKTQELKNKGGNAVEYSVTIQDGRVKLKARISA
jgi:hypothetical protein